ncbi:MAG: TIGR03862 family flavoprotein [Phreatobacter sp.]|uniref:NAD(P)/FAD-dependent oxidoreductase n=1 Tax=Phreatobacter sp. TaxID=1966341 RepID=UPI0027329A28|nr:TIGR03862 family flavoprotein [Phreatobacter sp.]MDP2803257.1 TIGR03862 family flavoprotein [Phreatobacter sp.]
MTRAPAVVVVGAGPAGLFAAERLATAGAAVTVYDRMPSPARKLLLAGRGGLNLTHSEPRAAFRARYEALPPLLSAALEAFPPAALRAWAAGLGEPTFVGTSGRVFPEAFKASPLVRAWLARLAGLGVSLVMRHRLVEIAAAGALTFEGPEGRTVVPCDAALLALGGASWPRMGSDGGWTPLLEARGVALNSLRPSNMGVEMDWTEAFAARFAGQPLKSVAFRIDDRTARGEATITAQGLEGGAIYALSAPIRESLATHGAARLHLDLKPDLDGAAIARRLAGARPKDSLSAVLKKTLALTPQAIALLREAAGGPLPRDPAGLAALVKDVVLPVPGVRPLDRAISTAGGVRFDALGEGFELARLPGIFVAGEMLDWEGPTGGYLLQATFATAAAAAAAMAVRLGLRPPSPAARW